MPRTRLGTVIESRELFYDYRRCASREQSISPDWADTGTFDVGSDLKFSGDTKLLQHPTAPLAWGTSGNVTLGMDLSAWISGYAWPPNDWDHFRKDVAEYLADLNGVQRKLMKRAGAKPSADDLATVLFAGWLDTPLIFAVHWDGKQEVNSGDQFYAIGSGRAFAQVAYDALILAPRRPARRQAFGIGVLIAAHRHRYCNPPINVWPVTSKGIKMVLENFGTGKEAPIVSKYGQ